MAISIDIDRTENRDFHIPHGDDFTTHFIDLNHNFLDFKRNFRHDFEKVVLMYKNLESNTPSTNWYLSNLEDQRSISEMDSIKINVIDYNNSCERCGKRLPQNIPWYTFTKLCKECEGALDLAYTKRLPWDSEIVRSNGWVTFDISDFMPIRTPFADWF